MINGVLFDMGGTLLDYGGLGNWEAALRATYQAVYHEVVALGYPGDWPTFERRIGDLEQHLWREATSGRATPTLASTMLELLASCELAATAAAAETCCQVYQATLQSKCEVFPDSAATLASLRARGLKLGLISNSMLPGAVHQADLARFGLLDHFSDVIFSADVGLWKPNATIFELALGRLGLAAAEAVFVGDRLIDDVAGAQSAGMSGILISPLPGDGPDYGAGVALGIQPTGRLRSLGELPALLDRLARA